jgi:hypothetical protein
VCVGFVFLPDMPQAGARMGGPPIPLGGGLLTFVAVGMCGGGGMIGSGSLGAGVGDVGAMGEEGSGECVRSMSGVVLDHGMFALVGVRGSRGRG